MTLPTGDNLGAPWSRKRSKHHGARYIRRWQVSLHLHPWCSTIWLFGAVVHSVCTWLCLFCREVNITILVQFMMIPVWFKHAKNLWCLILVDLFLFQVMVGALMKEVPWLLIDYYMLLLWFIYAFLLQWFYFFISMASDGKYEAHFHQHCELQGFNLLHLLNLWAQIKSIYMIMFDFTFISFLCPKYYLERLLTQ